jgi:hypothetical protein
MKHRLLLSLRLAVVGFYILIACWFVPDGIAESLKKGVGDE